MKSILKGLDIEYLENCLDLLFYMCKGETLSWLGETV